MPFFGGGIWMQTLQVSSSIKELRYSIIREMVGMAAGKTGIINLGIGEPDFETPPEVIEKAFQDARAGHTHYTPSQGDPELLEKLASQISNDTGILTPASSVLVTQGGMGALTAAFRSILEKGDEVLLIEPHFPDYLGHITLAGGVATTVVARIENQFIPDPKEIAKAITRKTKVLVLNSPNNPTGAVLPSGVLDAIAELVVHHNLIAVSDEVYDRIIFDNNPCQSIITRPEMINRTLVVKSFSKSYAMTGWRIGYCHGPQPIIEQMLKVVNYSTACASSIGQRAAIAALALGDK
jgi:aminotransferase